MAYCKVLSRHLPTGTEEIHETTLRNNPCLAEIGKKYVLIAGQERYIPTDFVLDLGGRSNRNLREVHIPWSFVIVLFLKYF